MSKISSETSPAYISKGLSSMSTPDLLGILGADPLAAQDALNEADGELRRLVAKGDFPTLCAAHELFTRMIGQEVLRTPLLNPTDSGKYLTARLAHLEYEVFTVLWLDNRHRVLRYEELFRGTVDGSSVHPREVVKAGLAVNAVAAIFAHNHPSGAAEPSQADRNITRTLQDALKLVEIRVLDHLIIGTGAPTSMAARGLI